MYVCCSFLWDSKLSLNYRYAAFSTTLRELGQAHGDSQHNLWEMTREFEDTKRLVKNGLDGTCYSFCWSQCLTYILSLALQPMLDDSGTLARAAETKGVLKALQDELSSCKSPTFQQNFSLLIWYSAHQVTDVLRDKLLDHASQLAEARGRIRGLEAEKQGSLAKLLHAKEDEERNFGLLFGVGKRALTLTFCFLDCALHSWRKGVRFWIWIGTWFDLIVEGLA